MSSINGDMTFPGRQLFQLQLNFRWGDLFGDACLQNVIAINDAKIVDKITKTNDKKLLITHVQEVTKLMTLFVLPALKRTTVGVRKHQLQATSGRPPDQPVTDGYDID